MGTFGKKLFLAEDPNRAVGGLHRGPSTVMNSCTNEAASGATGALNPCFGVLRTWKYSVTSNYNALQVSFNKKMTRGLAFTCASTWSHTLDFRSTWHSGTSGGSATESPYTAYGASGYSLDPNAVFLEYGNSLFDVRHRWVTSIVWEMPWMKEQRGVSGHILGGWQMNWNIAFQSGFPFTVGARTDFNADGINNDRVDTPSFGNSYSFSPTDFLSGSGPDGGSVMSNLHDQFPAPASGTDGNLGRNTFRGPGFANADFSLFKKFNIGERFKFEFRSEFFNIFNHPNFYPPQARWDNSNFGLAQQAFDPRVIQFGLRLSY